MASFEILRAGKRDNLSVIFPDAATRNLAVSVSSIDDNEIITAKLAAASDKEIIGFLARNITVAGGPTLQDEVFNKGLESADKAGGYTSVEDVEWFAVEGSANLDATHPPTAAGQFINFKAGLPQIAQSGEYYSYIVTAKVAAVEEGNTDRFICKRVETRVAA